MKKVKQQLTILICTSLACILLISSIVAVIDPFFVYHKPLEGWYYTIDNQLEQNPGMARHFDYDSVLLGSSMTNNFDTNLFNEALGTNMLKLSYNAAHPEDIHRIMDIITEEKAQLSHVYLCIDVNNYMFTPGTLSHTYPEHLYNKNPFDDFKYLLNKEVITEYILKSYLKKENTPVNEVYWHWDTMIYDADFVLSRYQAASYPLSKEYNLKNLKENLETRIAPYVETMPDTDFHIFFPPYSMLYWHNSIANDELDLKIQGMSYITEFFTKYENVNIHYFQNEEEWICDLNNYTDTTHFSKPITDEITRKLCSGENVVTTDTFADTLDSFREYVLNFDYDVYFKQ